MRAGQRNEEPPLIPARERGKANTAAARPGAGRSEPQTTACLVQLRAAREAGAATAAAAEALLAAALERSEEDPAHTVAAARLRLALRYGEAVGANSVGGDLHRVYADAFYLWLAAGIDGGELDPRLQWFRLAALRELTRPERDHLFSYEGLQILGGAASTTDEPAPHIGSTLMEQQKLEQRDLLETRMFQPVFPGHANHYDTLFGGEAMAWLDQAAFICATRWCRSKVVTAHIDAIDFHHAVPVGSIVELVARLVGTGRTSLRVHVAMWVEPMERAGRTLACEGSFVLVALDADNNPLAVPPFPQDIRQEHQTIGE